MRPLLVAYLLVVLASTLASAGPNAGGGITLGSANLTYVPMQDECGKGMEPYRCLDLVTEIDNASPDNQKVWKVYAAFPDESHPRLRGFRFGITYDNEYGDGNGLVITAHGNCADAEAPDPPTSWPAPNTGDSITWNITQTKLLLEAYWFAGYNYYKDPDRVRPDPASGGRPVLL